MPVICKDCEKFGKYWIADAYGNKVYVNWERNWIGCRLEKVPENCPKNAKVEVKA